MSTSTVRGYGTLLQRAVNVTDEERLRFGKEDFVRILLDFGFVCILMPFFKYFSIASLALTPTALIGAWRYDGLDGMSNILKIAANCKMLHITFYFLLLSSGQLYLLV